MIVGLIIGSEIAFWVVLLAGLAVRYLLRKPRLGLLILLAVPLVDVVLLVATALDLRGGATAGWQHSLAAIYLGFTVAFGHSMIRWADERFAHRFAGGPKPVVRTGRARALYEWKMWGLAVLACAIAAGLLWLGVKWINDPARTEQLSGSVSSLGTVLAVWFLIALSYTVFPKKAVSG
jgi:hypothetical protein